MLYVRLEIYETLNPLFWNNDVSGWRFIMIFDTRNVSKVHVFLDIIILEPKLFFFIFSTPCI